MILRWNKSGLYIWNLQFHPISTLNLNTSIFLQFTKQTNNFSSVDAVGKKLTSNKQIALLMEMPSSIKTDDVYCRLISVWQAGNSTCISFLVILQNRNTKVLTLLKRSWQNSVTKPGLYIMKFYHHNGDDNFNQSYCKLLDRMAIDLFFKEVSD